MTFEPGQWVGLPNGTVARVLEVKKSSNRDVVRVESVDGKTFEHPLGNARARWIPLQDVGLRVRHATDPVATSKTAKKDPVGIVVAALHDLGGEAATDDIRKGVAAVLDVGDTRLWWKRVQQKLEDDPRVDASRALEKRYRVLKAGEIKPRQRRPRVSENKRLGRRLLDTPTLLSARERASSKEKLDDEAKYNLISEAKLSEQKDIDPTDRFLAGEIGLGLRLWTPDELAETLATDVLAIDLFRIREHDSRERALHLADRRLHVDRLQRDTAEAGPVLWSAVALGDRWRDLGFAVAERHRLAIDGVIAGAVRWSSPGSEEAGDITQLDELTRYRARLARLKKWAFGGDGSKGQQGPAAVQVARGLLSGGLAALTALGRVSTHGTDWEVAAATVGELVWRAEASIPGEATKRLRESPVTPELMVVLVETAPPSALGSLQPLVEAAYQGAREFLRPLASLTERRGQDLAATLLRIARDNARTSGVAAIARDAALTSSQDLRVARESDTLAGTLMPEHPELQTRRARMVEEAISAAVSGEATWLGPVLLDEKSWNGLLRDFNRLLIAALEERDAALEAQTDMRDQIARLQSEGERRREALAEVQVRQGQQESLSTRRLGVNVLRPVAAALSDSYEAGALGPLQDQLLSTLARVEIKPVAQPGSVIPFDPDYHRWVGEGYPTRQVKVLTPGYVAARGTDDEVVLAPARVVAA